MLKDNLVDQLKKALRSGDSLRVSTLRLLLNALHNEEIAKQRELTSDEETGIVRRQLKQREEAIESYDSGGRQELAQKERREAEILKEFLPEQIGVEELERMVKQVIEETGAVGLGDFGKVMQKVMAQVRGRADGKMVAEKVREELI